MVGGTQCKCPLYSPRGSLLAPPTTGQIHGLLLTACGGSRRLPRTAGRAPEAGAGTGIAGPGLHGHPSLPLAAAWETPGEGAFFSSPCTLFQAEQGWLVGGPARGWEGVAHTNRLQGSQATALGAGGLRGHRGDTPFPGEGSGLACGVPAPSSAAHPTLHRPLRHRGPRCTTWSYLLMPTAQPGQFSVVNGRGEMGGGGGPAWGALAGGPLTGFAPSEPGAPAEELQVHDTDYTTFALMVSRRRSGSQSILRVYLLCEPRPLPAATLGRAGWPATPDGVPTPGRPCRPHRGPRPVLGPQAECGQSRSRRWTGSSACSEPRASRRATSSFQTQQVMLAGGSGWGGPWKPRRLCGLRLGATWRGLAATQGSA